MEECTSLVFGVNCCSSFSELVYMKNMSSIYLRYNWTFCLINGLMCVSSNIAMKIFAYVGAHFVPIAHPFICKKLVQLNIKLINVNINFRKLMITSVWRFFRFSVVSTALIPSLSTCWYKVNERPWSLKSFFVILYQLWIVF